MTDQPVVVQIRLSGLSPSSIGAIDSAEKGVALGVATLGADRKVPPDQLPANNSNEGQLDVEAIIALVNEIINNLKGAPDGLATLNDAALLTVSQQPNGMLFFYNYNEPFGIPKLDAAGLIEEQSLPPSIKNRLATLEQEVEALKAAIFSS